MREIVSNRVVKPSGPDNVMPWIQASNRFFAGEFALSIHRKRMRPIKFMIRTGMPSIKDIIG